MKIVWSKPHLQPIGPAQIKLQLQHQGNPNDLKVVMSDRYRAILSFTIVVIAGIIGYHQVVLLHGVLRWDMMDVHLPALFYMSEALSIGEFPWWNPYTQLGYPYYADPQVTPWYPIALLYTFLLDFGIHSLHGYFMIHVLLAGLGFLWLARSLSLGWATSCAIGIAYMASGFFAGNGQHLLIITGGTWAPFVLAGFLRLLKDPGILKATQLAVCTVFLITGGYPFISIILFGLLLVLAMDHAIGLVKVKNGKALARLLAPALVTLVLVVLVCLPFFLSLMELLPNVQRSDGVDLENALRGSLTSNALLYSLIPYSLVRNASFFGTDIAMNNTYFGIVMLAFVVYNLFQKKRRLEWVLFLFGCFSLTAALGQELPVRSFLYEYVPLTDHFKYPALFRLFTIICLLLFAGFGIEKMVKRNSSSGTLQVILITLIGVMAAFVISVSAKVEWHGLSILLSSLVQGSELNDSTFEEHVFLHGLIQIAILVMAIFIIRAVSHRKGRVKYLLSGLIAADVLIALGLNLRHTTLNMDYTPQYIQSKLDELPRGFPVPTGADAFVHTGSRIKDSPIYRNVDVFRKQLAVNGFTSIRLKDYMRFLYECPQLKPATLSNPVIFLTDRVFHLDSMISHATGKGIGSTNIYLDSKAWSELDDDLRVHPTDSVRIERFGPNNYVFQTSTRHPAALVFLQSYFEGWQVRINGQAAPLYKTNYLLMSTVIPKGHNSVEFSYERPMIRFFALCSAVLLLAMVGVVCFQVFRDDSR